MTDEEVKGYREGLNKDALITAMSAMEDAGFELLRLIDGGGVVMVMGGLFVTISKSASPGYLSVKLESWHTFQNSEAEVMACVLRCMSGYVSFERGRYDGR